LKHLRKLDRAQQGAMLDSELVMIHVDSGVFVSLKDSGLRVWELLDSTGDLDRICETLVGEYDVAPEECRVAVEKFADQLVEGGFAEYA
jgi:hypothetical protein